MKKKCKLQHKLKPFIGVLLAVLLVIGLAPASLFSVPEVLAKDLELSGVLEGTDGDITWKLTALNPEDWDLNKNGVPYKLTLSGTGNGVMKDYKRVSFQDGSTTNYYTSAPWQTYTPYICSLEIGNGITNIGKYAFFNCVSLKAVTIPSSVASIGDYAFSNCFMLESVTGGGSLETIGVSSFNNTRELRTVQLSGSRLKSIGSDAFESAFNSSTMSTNQITLPSTLETIGSYAFAYSKLKSIVLPGSVKTIGSAAFSGSYIQDITLPASMPLNTIESSVFSGSSLKSITLPNNITSIKSNAFYNCESLSTVTFNNGLQIIGSSAFSCTDSSYYYGNVLTEITLPDSVTNISSSAFARSKRLNTVTFGANLLEIGDSAFKECALSTVNFRGGSLTTIGNSSFADCASLQTISLPGSVTTMKPLAFSGSGLTSFTVPQSASKIDYGILYDCGGLDSITVAAGNSNFVVKEDALYEVRNGVPYRAVAYPIFKEVDSYTIADGTQIIDKFAFSKCKLSNLVLSDSVTTLNDQAFEHCANLSSVVFGKSVTTISTGDYGAFHECRKLETLETPSEDSVLKAEENVLYNNDFTELYFYAFAKPDSVYHVLDTVKKINEAAIYDVPALVELYLPETLETLDSESICSGGRQYNETSDTYGYKNGFLKSIYFAGGEPVKTSNSIIRNADDLLLYRLKDAQWNETAWNYEFAEWDPNEDFEDSGEIEPSEDFGGLSWKYESFNGRLTLEGTEFIPDYNLDSDSPPWDQYIGEIQTIEAHVEQIGEYAFYGADRLRRLATDSRPTKIGDHAFENCGKLVYITFKDDASIGNYAFAGNTCLKGIGYSQKTLQLRNATFIGAHAFENCSTISGIDLRNSAVETIGEKALAGCTSLTAVSLPPNQKLAVIGAAAFKDCSSLTSMTLPVTITTIDSAAFGGCTKLASIDIPYKVTAIADGTFEGCASLSRVKFNTSANVEFTGITSIGKNAFSGCTALETFTVPSKTISVGANAFSGNTSLKKVYFEGAYPKDNIADDCFTDCHGDLTLYYVPQNDEGERWASYNGVWNGLPLKLKDRNFTEGRDYYSFNNSAPSFGYSYGYRIPRQRYVDALDSIITGTYYYTINKYWGGSCYGMASTALEFYENINDKEIFNVQSHDPSKKYTYELDAPKSPDNALTQIIETYQVSQYQPQISSCIGEISRNMNQYAELRKRIEGFKESGGLKIDENTPPIVIAVYSSYSAHALVPVSWNQMEDGSGNYEIKVYDCNYPDSFQSLIINEDMESFSYQFYDKAISFVDYRTIAAGMAEVQPLEEEAADTLYLSVNKEAGNIMDDSGNGIDDIEGAYEQKPFTGNEEDVFSGIKSYVLPKGSYTLAADTSEEDLDSEEASAINEPEEDTDAEDDLTFYMAANDLFAEVTASDEDAALSVDTSDTVEDKVEMTLTSGESSAEDGYTSITLMNDSGLERVIEVSGYDGDIKVGVSEEEVISITASQTSSVTIDGQKANSENGQVLASFTSTADENPFKVSGLSVTAHCDEKNKLSADISAHVLNRSESVQPVELTAEFYDKDNHRVAVYSDTQELKQGLEFVSLYSDLLNTNFKQDEGEAVLYCKLTVKSGDFSVSAVSDGVTVSLTKQPSTGNPDDGNENDPGNNPGNNEPDDGKEPGGDNNEPDDGKEPDGDNNPDDSKEPGDSNNSGDTNQPNDGSVSGDGTNTTGPADTNINPLVKEVESVSASINKIKIGVGESYRLETSVTPADAVNQTLIFTSSNKNVTVNKDGIIKGKKAGTSWIMVSSENGKTARVKVDVKKAPKRFELNATTKRLKKGRTFQIKVKLPKKTASHKITFTSNKKSVAAVSATGKVKALKKGSAVITVKTFNGKKAKLKVRVK